MPREEGVEFQFNVQPQYIACDEDGRLTAVGLIRTAMGEPGPDGRRRPRPVAGSEFELPAMFSLWPLVSRHIPCRGCRAAELNSINGA